MREIKFRGRCVDTGEWVYGYLIGNDVIVGNIVEFNDEYFNTEFWYKVDPKTVGQFTGLKDQNGKGIYEGDIILLINKLVRHVEYDRGAFVLVKTEYFTRSELLYTHLSPIRDYITDYRCVVIGNIYEHSHLIGLEDISNEG